MVSSSKRIVEKGLHTSKCPRAFALAILIFSVIIFLEVVGVLLDRGFFFQSKWTLIMFPVRHI